MRPYIHWTKESGVCWTAKLFGVSWGPSPYAGHKLGITWYSEIHIYIFTIKVISWVRRKYIHIRLWEKKNFLPTCRLLDYNATVDFGYQKCNNILPTIYRIGESILYSNMGNDFVPIWSPLEHTSSRDQGYQSSDKILLVIYGIFDVNGHISLVFIRSDLFLVFIRHSES